VDGCDAGDTGRKKQIEIEHSEYLDRKCSTSSSSVDESPWTEDDFLFEERMRTICADFDPNLHHIRELNRPYARYRLVGGRRKYSSEREHGNRKLLFPMARHSIRGGRLA
jgi:hypothetical protein